MEYFQGGQREEDNFAHTHTHARKLQYTCVSDNVSLIARPALLPSTSKYVGQSIKDILFNDFCYLARKQHI
jgi:hypothetical protein